MLYLNSNNLHTISGLEDNTSLQYLNISYNKVGDLRDISNLPKLETVIASHNLLTNLQFIKPPASLEVLDISDNPLEASEVEVMTFINTHCQSLLQLYIHSCPATNRVTQFRRRVINSLNRLRFLDKQVITEDDRECAKAWADGGRGREAAVRLEIAQKKRENMDILVTNFRDLQSQGITEFYRTREDRESALMKQEEQIRTTNAAIVEDMRKILLDS